MIQDTTDKILSGIIYSKLTESEFVPQIWIPQSLSSDIIPEIIKKTTSHISVKGENWTGKISILPLPIYKFIGLTYFYDEPTNIPNNTKVAAITLLINENSSDFLYRNLDRFKRDLEVIAKQLNVRDTQRDLILSQFYNNLLEFINRFLKIRKLTDDKEKFDTRNECALLSFFHSKLGTMPFYCYPEDVLSAEHQSRISRELEYDFKHGIFTTSYLDFKAIHLYFELPSSRARGKLEMCLISLIFENMPSEEMMNIISIRLLDLIDNLFNEPNVTLAFYKGRLKENLEETEQKYQYLRKWVKEVYESCIGEYYRRSSEVRFARILMDPNRAKLLQKLSEGPISFKKLQDWAYAQLGKKIDLTELLTPLVNSNYAIIKKIEKQDHIILLKGLRAYRISPINTLEKLKSFDSIYPEIYPDLLKLYEKEVSRFFRKYKINSHEMAVISRIILNPVNYLIISMFRKVGIYLQTDFEEKLNKNIRQIALFNLELLKEQNIITQIKAYKESFLLLKTDIKFITTIPKFILLGQKEKNILPAPLNQVSNNVSEVPDRVKTIFKRWFS
ncbi:MAG TPA: hypothetical protein VMV49_16480 [Candidatus Deferrimicrobium sp.]|nr:hypothetical protein [Candidatus Deferrimicrobium sp.]